MAPASQDDFTAKLTLVPKLLFGYMGLTNLSSRKLPHLHQNLVSPAFTSGIGKPMNSDPKSMALATALEKAFTDGTDLVSRTCDSLAAVYTCSAHTASVRTLRTAATTR